MTNAPSVTIDGIVVPIEGEVNLLEIVRKAGIELPTFCYHSELSVYGACRMCVVEIEKQGIQASCTVAPQDGMVISTNTDKLRNIRRTILELLLANHDRDCTTCDKSGYCKLQSLAERFNVKHVRFKRDEDEIKPLDYSIPALVRDPNKCILCGDCVRVCSEIQGIGILDFANRGSKTTVGPAFDKNICEVDCVQCGQCTTVCPTGALMVKLDTDTVWQAINDKSKTTVVHVAPAVRVALAEEFGGEPGTIATGKMIAALKKIGFDYVFDTTFTADMTIAEETNEFLGRFTENGPLPLFTSCCPAWVKYVEHYHPELIPNLSSCKSPMGMFGAISKEIFTKNIGVEKKDLYVVAVMPCTAKKFEITRDEFIRDGIRDNDAVITTRELGRMIKEFGIDFDSLEPESFDQPMGMGTGGGMIFGNTGGVAEAVLREAAVLTSHDKKSPKNVVYQEVRGAEYIKEAHIEFGDVKLEMAVAHSLSAAEEIIRRIQSGEKKYDIVEIMACPGGCIGGGGQPMPGHFEIRKKRAKSLYNVDKEQTLRIPLHNPALKDMYETDLGGKSGSHIAHELLHTTYHKR